MRTAASIVAPSHGRHQSAFSTKVLHRAATSVAVRRKRFKREVERLASRFRALPCYYELRQLGIVDHFRGYPSDAIKPQWDDLQKIYRLVMARRPAVILELGGGYSTFVIAHAVKQLADAGYVIEFHSVGDSEHWQSVVKSRMPAHLAHHIEFFHAVPVLTEINGQLSSMFDRLPINRCNLVYVDGGLVPGHRKNWN